MRESDHKIELWLSKWFPKVDLGGQSGLPKVDWWDQEMQRKQTSMQNLSQIQNLTEALMDLLKRVEQSQCEAEVFWYYEEEDEDMEEAGEDYAAIIQLPFKLVETTIDD